MAEEELRKRYEAYLDNLNIHLVRSIARQVGVEKPTNGKKEELIQKIIDVRLGIIAPVPTSKRGAPLKEEAPSPKYIEALDRIRDEYKKENIGEVEKVVRPQTRPQGYESLFFATNVMSVHSSDATPRPPRPPFWEDEEPCQSALVEIFSDGNGRLLLPNGRAMPETIRISSGLIKSSFVREGDIIDYNSTFRADGEVWVKKVERINGKYIFAERLRFEEDAPCYPVEKINFVGNGTNNLTCKCLNLFGPMAKGQRISLRAPIGTDIIRFFIEVANTAKREMQALVLLLGEAPEEIGRFMSEAPSAEVISTTFDQTEADHARAIRVASARAMRLAEDGNDVLFFVNSLSDAAKLFQSDASKRLPCGLNADSVRDCKKMFALARDLKRLGSITLFGAIREGESAEDKYITEEFDRLANCHIVFSRDLASQYVSPPIDLARSYTDREYLLLSKNFLSIICNLRLKADKEGSKGIMNDLDKAAGEKGFLDKMSSYQS
jgi:transcription termination factor Rho